MYVLDVGTRGDGTNGRLLMRTVPCRFILPRCNINNALEKATVCCNSSKAGPCKGLRHFFKGIPGPEIPRIEAFFKPVHPLLRGTVRKSIRHHAAAGLFLNSVVAHG